MGGRKVANLVALIEKEKWAKVLERIASHPNETESSDEYGYLPIHHACECENVPVQVIEALIAVNPESVSHKSPKDGLMPLNFAVSCKSSTHADVVKVLLRYYKEGASTRDRDGRSPLHSHLCDSSQPSLEIVKMLVKAHPDAVRTSDKHLWYPLHYAAKYGNWEVSQYLIDLYPDALLARTESGETPREVGSTFGQRQLCYKLREEEETRFGDRIGIVPNDNQTDDDDDVMMSRDDSDSSLSVNAILEYADNTAQADDNRNEKSPVLGSMNDTRSTAPQNIVSLLSNTTDRTEEAAESTLAPQRQHGRHLVSPCKDSKENATVSSHGGSGKSTTKEGNVAASSGPTNGKRKLMDGLLQNLEEAEAFWGILPLTTQSIVSRVLTLEKKVFQEVKVGGVKSRVLALFYVDGPKCGTWAEWVNGIEYILLNGKQKGSVIDRIEYLEWLVEGEAKTGNIRDRLLALNKMQTEASAKPYEAINEDGVPMKDTTVAGKPKLMHGLLQNLEGAEAIWDVLPMSTKSVVHRITTIENKVFNEAREGGLKSRLLALFYVQGISNGTWEEWIDGIEYLLQNEKQKGSIIERIKNLELLVEGEFRSGYFNDRLMALNQMTTQNLCLEQI